MRAVILAAGRGTRLKPITDSRPKSMVEVNGKPILFKQLDNLLENGVEDVVVVAGYKSEILIDAVNEQYRNVSYIINGVYDKTNNMYSAYLALDYMYQNEFLLMNGDVFYDSAVLSELLGSTYKDSIVVDAGVYNEESMKVSCHNGRIVQISKGIDELNSYGVSIDVYKFSKEGSVVFCEMIRHIIEEEKDLGQWTEVALNRILSDVEFRPCPLKGRWMEIDDVSDLKKAESIFHE